MSQQNEWLIAQALDTDERQNIVEKKLEAFEILRIMVSSKWSVVGWIVTAILIPLGLVGATVWVKNHFGKID